MSRYDVRHMYNCMYTILHCHTQDRIWECSDCSAEHGPTNLDALGPHIRKINSHFILWLKQLGYKPHRF